MLTTKITFTNSVVKISKVKYTLIDRFAGSPSGSLEKYDKTWDDSLHFSHPDPNVFNAGVGVVIEYGCGHDKLIKPFIFVEGFNPKEFELTQLNYKSFYTKLFYYQNFYGSSYQLLTELQDNGYDIVYIDYDIGSADIRYNAKALAEAMKGINTLKAANGSEEQNILVGESMGGIVARLALTYLEHDSIDPEVDYYISIDSPHLGANVPRSLSLCVDDLYSYRYSGIRIASLFHSLTVAKDVLHSPAAKQMLIYGSDFPEHTAFQTHLTTQGMPNTTLQNIAIANGNAIGQNQGFGTYNNLANVDISSFNALSTFLDVSPFWSFMAGLGAATIFETYGKIKLNLNTLPGTVNTFYQIYERRITMKVLFLFPSWSKVVVKMKNTIPFDNAPGGSYDLNAIKTEKVKIPDPTGGGNDIYYSLPELVETWNPHVKLHIDRFCFIPTVSSLNIPSAFANPLDPLNIPVIQSSGETGFQKLYELDSSRYPSTSAAPANEAHTSFTPSSMEAFRGIINPDFNINQSSSIYGYTFNFGSAQFQNEFIETNDRIRRPITVSGLSSANGAIWINRDARLENINDQGNPLSTSDQFAVELASDCYGNYGSVTVGNLGSIVIGENDQKTAKLVVRYNTWIKMNDGFIEVRDGSKLIIEDGGELRLNGGILRIQDGGEVIIKAGGKLIYEAGTQIELNGNDAMLALGGLTRIGDNATFTFTYQGNESGYIRLLEEGNSLERFSVGTNAQVRLEGEGQNDLILYLEKSADFWEYLGDVPGDPNTSNLFKYFQLKNGKVVMDDHSRIVLLCESDIINVHMEATDYIHKPRGIVNFTFCEIKNSNFYHIDIDAQLQYWNEAPLLLTDSYFDGCSIGVRGLGMRLLGSHFYSTQVLAYQGTITNTVNSCLFENYSRLVDVSFSDLFVVNSEFYDNDYGIIKDMGRLIAKCSRFEQNSKAITGENLAEINLSTLYNGGYNYFTDNDYNIYLDMSGDVLLKDGYNGLYDANYFNISGLLDAQAPPCPSIIATNNTWTPHSGSQIGDPNLPDFDEFEVYVPNTCMVNFIFGNAVSLAKCGQFDETGGGDDPGKSNSEESPFPLISTPTYFDSVAYDMAVKEIASKTTVIDSINGDDALAADMYFELLNLAEMDSVISDSISIAIEQLRWGSLGNYKTTIERMFADSVLTTEENSSVFSPVVQNYVSVLMAFTDSVKTEENYRPQLKLELMKAALFNTIGKKNQALQIITNVNYCDHDSLQKLVLESQIQNLKFDLLAETYGTNMFLIDSAVFELDSAIFQIPFESFIDSSGFGSYIQGPNSILYSSCNTAFSQKSYGGGNTKNSKFNVYPNPAQSELHVQITDNSKKSDEGYEFWLLDFTGKIVFSTDMTGVQSNMGLPKLPSALYFYQIKSNGKVVDQGKLSILY